MDAITCHRLGLLGLDAGDLRAQPIDARMQTIYTAFLEAIPYENLSDFRSVCENPNDPESWPRATDRLLRENQVHGFGGTSFSLSYALRDLFRGAGGNAHTTLGYNLVTERAHAAVLLYDAGEPLLFDPALLLSGAIPVRPGGTLEDPLGTFTLVPRLGPTLTVSLTLCPELRPEEVLPPVEDSWIQIPVTGLLNRPIYSIIPVPAAPHNFRQAWLASFFRGRRMPLRIARRRANEIARYGERPGSVEYLRPDGREERAAPEACAPWLHEIFGLDAGSLEAWFSDT